MRHWLLSVAVVALFASIAAAQPDAPDSYVWHLPKGVAPPSVPQDNPMSAAKVELGRRLFYDADLSIDGTTSCATCHEQHRAFTEGNATHPGVHTTPGRRNVMGLANVAYFNPLTWADSNQHVLETQALVPLAGEHPIEMGMAGQDKELSRRLAEGSCYRTMFAAAFPETQGRIEIAAVTKALGAFERTLLSFDSPYDRFQRGDKNAISAHASRGAALFSGALHCAGCHAGGNFTDQRFHIIGLAAQDSDHGLKEVTGLAEDEGAIRTPSLRNIALTGPYMHDGSVKSLSEAVRRHLAPDAMPDPLLKGVTLNPADEADLLAFLDSLSDTGFVTNPDLALPKPGCAKPL